MSERKLPDQIADFFIALIFVESLRAGDKLPPERQLANLLKVDRTSLRTALKILIRMNLMESVQGSGITILEMRTHAGVDMIDNVLRIPEIQLGSDLLIEWVNSFTELLPVLLVSAFKSHDKAELEKIKEVFQAQIDACKAGVEAEELVQFDIKLQDSMAMAINQPLLHMAANSTRRVRIMLMTKLYESVDLQKHFKQQMAMLEKTIDGSISLDSLQQQYKKHIQKLAKELIKQLKTSPKKSYLEVSPLEHMPKLLSIPQS